MSPTRGKVRAARCLLWLAVLCAVSVAVRDGLAGLLAMHGSARSLEAALAIAPDNPDLCVQLAHLLRADPSQAERRRRLLERAVSLNNRHTAARLALAGELEAAGYPGSALEHLRAAADFDRQFSPRWALANFYLRANRTAEAGRELLHACRMAARREAAVLELASRAGLAPEQLVRCLLGIEPDSARRLARHLARTGPPAAAIPAADAVLAEVRPGDIPLLLDLSDGLLARGHVTEARLVWNSLVSRGLTEGSEAEAWRVVPRVGVRAFGWRRADNQGFDVASRSGLTLTLFGDQPASANLLTQDVPVTPGTCRELLVDYSTEDLAMRSGLYLDVVSLGPPRVRLAQLPLTGSGTRASIQSRVCAAAGESLVRLVLFYSRAAGEYRAAGRVTLHDIRFSGQ